MQISDKKKEDIALFRYGVISPLIQQQGDITHPYSFFRSAADKEYQFIDGSLIRLSATTLSRWYEAYKNHGFDALKPKGRCDICHSRKLTAEMKNEIGFLVKEYPRLPATQIYEKLLSNGTITKNEVSLSTITRHVSSLKKNHGLKPMAERRRYEREHINEVWCGDSSHGPYITVNGEKKKVYIIALLDDASRMITGIDVFFEDNFVNLMKVIKSAVSTYGKPQLFNFDNGSNYKSHQMSLLGARIGCTIHHCKVRSPESKAKVERFFKTLKDHWMATIKSNDYHSLDEVRYSLKEWISKYNATPHSALDGQTPINRFFNESDYIIRLTDEEIERSFLLEIDRKVSLDNVIVIDEKQYEIEDYRYQGQKVRIRYSPDLESIYVVDPIDNSYHPIRLLDKKANASVKRKKISFSQEMEDKA